VPAARAPAKREPALLAARSALKRFQAGRLARTHAALLAAPDSHDAALFFLDELYAAHDLSQRDIDLERIVPTMQRLLSYQALRTITNAIVLDALSERLDTAMARALGPEFSAADYLRAYRTVTAQDERAHQLALVQELGESLCALVKIPLLSATLSMMRAPARLAGLGELQQFLERGFHTFRKMRRPQDFVAAIVARERAVSAAIYADAAYVF
jgi:hypothetical protein